MEINQPLTLCIATKTPEIFFNVVPSELFKEIGDAIEAADLWNEDSLIPRESVDRLPICFSGKTKSSHLICHHKSPRSVSNLIFLLIR